MTTTAVLTPGCTSVRPAPEPRQVEDRGAQCRSLLAHVGLTVGDRALELGAGPSDALDTLAATVGTSGRVVSFEVDAVRAGQVRAFVLEHCLTNVDVIEGDTRSTALASASFDLVHVWLSASPAPDELLAEMVRLARPAGYVAVHGPEPGIGPGRLAELLRRAGLGEIGSETRPTPECASGGRQTDAPRLIRLAWGRKLA